MNFHELLNDCGNGFVYDSTKCQKTDGVFAPDLINNLCDLLYPLNWKVHAFCVDCKKEETFTVSPTIFSKSGSNKFFTETDIFSLPNFSFPSSKGSTKTYNSLIFPGLTLKNFELTGSSRVTYYFIYSITCDFDCDTSYTLFIRIEVDTSTENGSVRIYKVGQVPPLYVISSGDASEYREILSDMGAYDDYLQAIKSHQQGLEAGACCYLRRALSHMIKYYAKNNSITFEKNETTANKLKTLEEKGIITTDAKEILNPLYSDLSEGDHSLEETDNSAFYPSLLGALQFQLADAQAKRDYEKKKATVKSSLASVTKVIGSKH